MTISERAKIIPDEALTNHHIQDDSVDFTREDISNAYVAGAKDVINIINDIIKIEMLQADIDERFPDYKGIVEDIINEQSNFIRVKCNYKNIHIRNKYFHIHKNFYINNPSGNNNKYHYLTLHHNHKLLLQDIL